MKLRKRKKVGKKEEKREKKNDNVSRMMENYLLQTHQAQQQYRYICVDKYHDHSHVKTYQVRY
jgi:hypothetical protein